MVSPYNKCSEIGKIVQHLIYYFFSSNHNIHKSLCGLCFWAPDASNMIDFSKIYQLKVLEPKNKGHINFYECCDLTKNATYNRLEHFRALYVPKFEQNRLCSKLWRNEWSDSPISVVVIIMARSFPRHTHHHKTHDYVVTFFRGRARFC